MSSLEEHIPSPPPLMGGIDTGSYPSGSGAAARRIGGRRLLPSPTLSPRQHAHSAPEDGSSFKVFTPRSSAGSIASTDDSIQEPYTPHDDHAILPPESLPPLIGAPATLSQSSLHSGPPMWRSSASRASPYRRTCSTGTWSVLCSRLKADHCPLPSQTARMRPGTLTPATPQPSTGPSRSNRSSQQDGGHSPKRDPSDLLAYATSGGWSTNDPGAATRSQFSSGTFGASSGLSALSDALTPASSYIESLPTQSTLVALSESSPSFVETESSWGNLGSIPNSRAQSPFEGVASFPSLGVGLGLVHEVDDDDEPSSPPVRRREDIVPPSPTRSLASTVTHDEDHGGFIVSPRIHEHAAHASSVTTLNIYGLEKDFAVERGPGNSTSSSNTHTRSSTPSIIPVTPPLPQSQQRPTAGRSAFRMTTQSVPSSVALDSPTPSEASPGSPSDSPPKKSKVTGLSFVLTGSPPLAPVTAEDSPVRAEKHGRANSREVGLPGGRETEWLSRYAGAFSPRGSSHTDDHRGRSSNDAAGRRPGTAPSEVPREHRDRTSSLHFVIPSRARPRTALAPDLRVTAQRAELHISRRASQERPRTSDGAASTHSTGSTSNLLPAREGTLDAKRVSASSAGSSTLASGSDETAMDVRLPRELLFLTAARVELWIDQEGFRAIRPAFWLVTATAQVAEFRTRVRESFVFHHAALDSPPVLRRLTINGEEGRDYLSRQASLSVKNTGVYTVDGAEDRSRLPWQLKYVVQERLDVAGRPMSGEKTWTPVSFICSPHLFDPAARRGKKVHLLHVMKKTVVPNLVATRTSTATDDPSLFPIPLTNVAAVSFTQTPSHTQHARQEESPMFTGRPRAATHSIGQIAEAVQQLPYVSTTPPRPSTAEAVSTHHMSPQQLYVPTASGSVRPSTGDNRRSSRGLAIAIPLHERVPQLYHQPVPARIQNQKTGSSQLKRLGNATRNSAMLLAEVARATVERGHPPHAYMLVRAMPPYVCGIS
ncbi:hypothetical protein BKA62DRAFT_754881 [Auriculariales sp. MPI-PUGE-AT-0066]|nr:hypothetical protein BKA62DRAFT_754881 [Auriculariales sp. MPI-PUGE-AT-0066]